MATSKLNQRGAVLRVLEQRPNQELHYQRDVTNQISAQRLFQFNRTKNPAGSVWNTLNNMADPKHGWHDERVQRLGGGLFMLVDGSLSAEDVVEEADDDIDGPIVNDERIVGISAYGLYWEREKVKWNGAATKLMGRQTPESDPVDFAEQIGVYLLHNNGRTLYVGRTTDRLRSRLVSHCNPSNSIANQLSFRWNQFSWFGFRDVGDGSAGLKQMPQQIDANRFVAIMETVLIEALEPPINGRRGEYLGPIYQQVEDPDLAALRR